jgi:hypothetical protein
MIRRFLLILITCMPLCPAPALAQVPRGIPLTTISTTNPLTPEQRKEIEVYAVYYLDQLSGNPDDKDISAAREKLIEPIKGLQVTPVFRKAYSEAVLPGLMAILDQKDAGQVSHAHNAAQVAGSIGTNAAAAALLPHLSIDSEARPAIRDMAARSLALAVRQGDLSGVMPQQILRELTAAASIEPEPALLHVQFLALRDIAVAGKPGVDADSDIIELLNKTMERIRANPKDGPLFKPVFDALFKLRDRVLRDMSQAQHQALAPDLGATFTRVFLVAQSRWKDAQANPETKALYSNAINLSEVFLPDIPGIMKAPKPPGPGLKTAWENGDQAAFDALVAKWTAIYPPR